MNSELKCVLIVAGVLAIVYLINRYSSSQSSTPVVEQTENFESFAADVQPIPQDNSSDAFSSDTSLPTISMSDDDEKIKRKFDSKNKARGGYKRANYKSGPRGQVNETVEQQFADNNSLVKNGQLANDNYDGFDETNDMFASYKPSQKKPITDDDIFNADNYLPKEGNKDWFEVMPEPISAKNRHLINVSRPVGVNTVGNSLRNPTYDLRGNPANPKFVVSPWMQSTIEPDFNVKGLC
jgi:hypothetical protein